MALFIKVDSPELRALYVQQIATRRAEDVGFDLFTSEDILIPAGSQGIITFAVSCCVTEQNEHTKLPEQYAVREAYQLVPRSSIAKTPLIMTNSIGIIDGGYRGNLIAPVRNLSIEDYLVPRGTRLFQLLRGSLDCFTDFVITDTLPDSERGTLGFGSSGK
jgi:dUTP pyrophosphatase